MLTTIRYAHRRDLDYPKKIHFIFKDKLFSTTFAKGEKLTALHKALAFYGLSKARFVCHHIGDQIITALD